MNLSVIILIVCPALCIFTFIYLKWYVKRRTAESGVLKETNLKVKKWINEVNLSITDINETTERNLLLVEDKILKLKEILEDADKRISVYVKEVEKSRNSEALYTQLGRGVREAIKTEIVDSIDLQATPPVPPPAPQLSIVRPNLQPVRPIQPVQDTPSVKETKKPLSKKQIRSSIDELAGEGLSSQEIASQLGISIAEVELAMQLRRS